MDKWWLFLVSAAFLGAGLFGQIQWNEIKIGEGRRIPRILSFGIGCVFLFIALSINDIPVGNPLTKNFSRKKEGEIVCTHILRIPMESINIRSQPLDDAVPAKYSELGQVTNGSCVQLLEQFKLWNRVLVREQKSNQIVHGYIARYYDRVSTLYRK